MDERVGEISCGSGTFGVHTVPSLLRLEDGAFQFQLNVTDWAVCPGQCRQMLTVQDEDR